MKMNTKARNFLWLTVLVVMLILIPLIVYAVTPTVYLPRTGQTKCYNASGTEISCSGTGQDGELQVG
ncbi:MAG: hypothetical protein HZA00_01120, partial [Nitrospinae bacterium]|nr:hypothetical protein [Nitrospinota bacterium]